MSGGTIRAPRAAMLLVGIVLAGALSAARADAYVYWGNQIDPGPTDGTVGRALNDGTGVNQDFISGGNTVCGPTVSDTHVYWANRGGSSVGRANLDGSSPNQDFIDTGSSLPCGVGVNGTHVYWANGGVADAIGRANLDGTGVNNTFISPTDEPQGIALNSTHVFWGQRSAPNSHIGRAALDGTGNTDFIDIGAFPNESQGVAVNSTHIFWTDIFAGTIGRANLDGTGVDLDFISGLESPCGVTVDDSFIYWADAEADTIGRVGLDGSTGFDADFIVAAGRAPCGVAVDALPNTTNATVSCLPATVNVAQASTCTATVVDSSGSPTTPTGDVDFSSTGAGNFSGSGTCTLAMVNASTASCSLTYTPTAVGTGSHTVTGAYQGDNEHSADDGSFVVTVEGRATEADVVCIPNGVSVSEGTTCTATIDDVDPDGTPSAPTGNVTFSAEGPGGFSGNPCTLAAVDGDTSSCSVTYTPSGVGDGLQTVTGTYAGGGNHTGSNDDDTIAVSTRSTSTAVACVPSSVAVNEPSTCTATVTDTDPDGTASAPSGDVNFSSSGSGDFSGSAACTLTADDADSSSCSLTYTPTSIGTGTHSVTGDYAGSAAHAISDGSDDVTVVERSSATAVVCAPDAIEVAEASTCTATVTDTGAGPAIAPTGSAAFSSDTAGGGFGSGGSCALSPVSASESSCSLTYTPGQVGSGTQTISADYGGDAEHGGSQGSDQIAVSEGVLTLDAGKVNIVKSTFGATCALSSGVMDSCEVTAVAGGASSAASKPLASGSAAGGTPGNLRVTLKLTKRGKRLLDPRLGGLKVSLRASAQTSTGATREASAQTLLVARSQRVLPGGAMFGPDSAVLTKKGKSFLRKVARQARHLKSIRCEGHTASVEAGENAFTRRLGLARAKAACSYLKRRGLKAGFKAISFGKSRPRASNATPGGRARNRFVALSITHG